MPFLFTSAGKNIGVQPVLDLIARGMPSPLARPPVVCKTKEGEEDPVTPDPNGPFLAQVIHTTIDLSVGQVSVMRIFSGTPTQGREVLNASTGDKMRLGTPYLVRGKEFARVEASSAGTSSRRSSCSGVHTNNTLLRPQTGPRCSRRWRIRSR